jgi:hypothetical protein
MRRAFFYNPLTKHSEQDQRAEADMNTKDRAGTTADAAQGMEGGADADSDVRAVFESLEQLREAQAREAATAPAEKSADDGSLEAVLTHYKDWLRTLDR